jgi:hypothetical protein
MIPRLRRACQFPTFQAVKTFVCSQTRGSAANKLMAYFAQENGCWLDCILSSKLFMAGSILLRVLESGPAWHLVRCKGSGREVKA